MFSLPVPDLWQRQKESRAFTFGADHPHMSVMRFRRLLHNREANASPESASFRFGAPVKALKDTVSIVDRDHGAQTVDSNNKFGRTVFHRNVDGAIRVGVLGRIIQILAKYCCQKFFITGD